MRTRGETGRGSVLTRVPTRERGNEESGTRPKERGNEAGVGTRSRAEPFIEVELNLGSFRAEESGGSSSNPAAGD